MAGKVEPALLPTIDPEGASSPSPVDDRLHSWKEIAAYLNRDVRTVRRWEKNQGLPVHRHQHQKSASVYAYRSELDAWWKGEKTRLADEDPLPAEPSEVAPDGQQMLPEPRLISRYSRSWAVAATVIFVLVGLGYFALRNIKSRHPVVADRSVLAVLPFANLTGDPSQDFVADGFTEEMITQLSRVQPERLAVIARTSAMAFKGLRTSVGEIGQRLGADYVLEGSVRRWEDRVRVTAQLIRTRDQTHVWAENYESDRRDILGLQSEITQAIAQQINLRLRPAPSSTTRSVEPAAHELYLQGRHYLAQRTRDDLQLSVALFKQAIAKDATYAAAYAGLADAYNLIAFYGFDPDLDAVSQAKIAAQKAITLDDSLAAGHAALAYTEFMWQEDWSNAGKEFHRAIELDDNYVAAHQWYALYLAATGHMEEALSQVRYAQRLDPLSAAAHSSLSYILYLAGEYDQAIAQAQRGLELNPNAMSAHAVLGWTYTAERKYPEAITELQTAVRLSGGVSIYQCALARTLALSGNTAEARKVVQQIETQRSQPMGVGSALAAAYLSLGNVDKALQLLEETAPGDIQANWLMVDPAFAVVRNNPRFQAVTVRIGNRSD